MKFKGFIGGSFVSAAYSADQERLVNLYLERQEAEAAASEGALILVPGLEAIGTAASLGSGGRAHFYEAGREFALIGSAFVEISADGTVTSRGTVNTNGRPGTICSNGDGGGQILIVSGDNAYSFDLAANTFAIIAALQGKATMGGYLDGFGLVLDEATSTLYISAVLDFTSWTTGTDFAQRSRAPDKWKAMRVNNQYIGLYGQHTSEFWYNAGDRSFPFAVHPSGLIPYGVRAPWSVAVGEGAHFWLAMNDRGTFYVMRADAFTPSVVSTFPQHYELAASVDPSLAVGDIINWRGHQIYRLTFPQDGITVCYDVTSDAWFEWRTWISEQGRYSISRLQYPILAFGEYRGLDAHTGAIYRIRSDVYTDAESREIRWLRRTPPVHAEGQLVYHQALELLMDTGLGTTSGQGENPQVSMRWSNDHGKTWGDERFRSVGKTGEYSTRVRWERLGASRRRVYEFVGSDPIPWKLTGATLRLGQPVSEEAGS